MSILKGFADTDIQNESNRWRSMHTISLQTPLVWHTDVESQDGKMW